MDTKRGRFKFRFKKEQIVRALIISFKFQVIIIEFVRYLELLSQRMFIYDLLIEQGIGFSLPQSVCLKVDSVLVSSQGADRSDKNQSKSLCHKIIKHQTATQGYYALYSTS